MPGRPEAEAAENFGGSSWSHARWIVRELLFLYIIFSRDGCDQCGGDRVEEGKSD